MGIYIKGMEMPIDCALMLKIFPDGRVGVPVHLNWAGTMVVNDAEAVSVPPHGRLGDLDALMLKIQEYIEEYADLDENGYHNLKWCAMKETEMALNDAPTIIPVSSD